MFSRLIEHSYPGVRLKTVEALAKMRTNEAIKQLKKALDGPNTMVRRSAQKHSTPIIIRRKMLDVLTNVNSNGML